MEAEPFRWREDGWGEIGTQWGASEVSARRYFRKLRDADLNEESDELPDFEHDDPALRFSANVVRDLVAIGWQVKVPHKGRILIRPPKRPDISAEGVRAIQLRGRNDQLNQPSVRRFILEMERKKLSATGWHSIFSLFRDGQELASRLRQVSATELGSLISPYIQVVDSNSRCEWTGLSLADVWRYFRHTWVTPYQSVPGRTMNVLVRDAAAPNHPVIGIAALSSAVVHQTARDSLIGWQGDHVVERMVANPRKAYAVWLLDTLDRFFESLYRADLLDSGLIRELDLRHPDEEVIARLEQEAVKWKERHQKNPNDARFKSDIQSNQLGWSNLATSSLYRSKRCKLLATFLRIRLAFQVAGFSEASSRHLRDALHKRTFREAVRVLVARVKSERVGIDLMDISVCGAIPPYTHLLGGKLVCMLLTSPEIQKLYEDRYKHTTSIIASALKGEAVTRSPKLVCLSTTSLYGRNSSQYNRVSIPGVAVGAEPGDDIVYRRGGDGNSDSAHRSQGFGTFHFRKSTLDALEEWISHSVHIRNDLSARGVNYIFGEGTSPKLRKLREYIAKSGLPAEEALKHDRSRIVYYIALAHNVGDFLLGIDKKPRWIFPRERPADVTSDIADYWKFRWLSKRILSEEVLNAVSTHNLAYPITHGARVLLPVIEAGSAELRFDSSG